MSNYDLMVAELMERVEGEPLVLDPNNIHHEFIDGGHGQKLDMGNIDTNSELFAFWMRTLNTAIEEKIDTKPDMLVGVANGANRIAQCMAPMLGNDVEGMKTVKLPDKSLILAELTDVAVKHLKPDFVLICEDVTTTGSSSLQVVRGLRSLGVERVEVFSTWERKLYLPRFDEEDVVHHTVIKKQLKTYKDKEACEAKGYCAQGIELVSHTA